MDEPDSLPETDVRAIVRLLGEVAAQAGTGADFKTTRAVLMNGLCEIIAADRWAWSVVQFDKGKIPHPVFIDHGGFDEESYGYFVRACEADGADDAQGPVARQALSSQRRCTVYEEQVATPEFYTKECIAFWEQAGNGSFIVSAQPVAGGSLHGIGIYRQKDRPPFTARESRIAHILLSEIPWLHDQEWPSSPRQSKNVLTPRQYVVLNLLIQGWARKRIASHLGLSVHTVHGYIKAVYRHFGVNSQPALIARFTRGDGGDVPVWESKNMRDVRETLIK
ncbi:MAG TPA: helix-turn-helix transcriptional regulator [Chthoniobacterales bacterium]